MNKPQFVVLWLAILLAVAALLFPPWIEFTILSEGRAFATRPAGYSFMATPPKREWRRQSVRIDTTLLAIELAVVALLATALVVSLRERGKEK